MTCESTHTFANVSASNTYTPEEKVSCSNNASKKEGQDLIVSAAPSIMYDV